SEELQLRQRVRRVDAQERVRPRRPHAICADNLDAPAHSQPVGDAGVAARLYVEVAVEGEAVPEVIAEGRAGDLFSALPRFVVIARREISAGGALGQVIPVIPPGALDGAV